MENSSSLVWFWSATSHSSALTAELWDSDTFQHMIWDTGSGKINILFVKINTQNAFEVIIQGGNSI